MKKSIFAVSTVVMLASGVALAQSAPEFKDIDSNQDGVLNKQEADSALPALGLRDSDMDGVISKGDVKAVLSTIEFSETDTGAVGEAEYQQIVQVIEEQMNETSS